MNVELMNMYKCNGFLLHDLQDLDPIFKGGEPKSKTFLGGHTSSLKSFLKWASEAQNGGRGHAGRAVKFVTIFDRKRVRMV